MVVGGASAWARGCSILTEEELIWSGLWVLVSTSNASVPEVSGWFSQQRHGTNTASGHLPRLTRVGSHFSSQNLAVSAVS